MREKEEEGIRGNRPFSASGILLYARFGGRHLPVTSLNSPLLVLPSTFFPFNSGAPRLDSNASGSQR